MSYKIYIRRQAQNDLDDAVPEEFDKIKDAIDKLANDPRPRGVKKLAQNNLWRVRVGMLRIIYSIDDVVKTVTILRVSRRNERTYKHLK